MRFFVSYRRHDTASRKLAAALLSLLSDKEHTVFVDEHTLAIGEPWRKAIHEQIAACDAVILLVCRGIGESKYVAEEMRAARRYGKSVRPVLVQYPDPQDDDMGPDVAAFVREGQHFLWRSKDNTPYLVAQLTGDESPPPPPPPPRRLRAWPVVAVAVLLAAAGLATLRILRVRAARALDARAATLLKSESREDVDRGLVLAALAAAKRGDAPSAAARAAYDALHYGGLVATLRGPAITGGNALAVSPNGDAVVDGNRIWRCVPPERLWRCPEPGITPLANAGILDSAVFVSRDEIVTLNVAGEALRWGVTGEMRALTGGTTATAIDAARGEIAIAFDNPPSVVVHDGAGAAESPPPEGAAPVRMLAFGPCRTCLTILEEGGDVYVWDRAQGTIRPVARNARAIAASTQGHLAVANDDGLLFLDAGLAAPVVHPRVALTELTSMDLSDDGRQAALVHDGRVTIVDRGGNEIRLVSGDMKPGAVAARFHRDVVVTRSPTDIRVWRRDSLEREKGAPLDAWPEWRDQLGLPVDKRGNFLDRVVEPDH